MTQNKKKGIAKKAISISLVAAMLATSNVPVWASFEAEPVDAAQGFALEEASPQADVAESDSTASKDSAMLADDTESAEFVIKGEVSIDGDLIVGETVKLNCDKLVKGDGQQLSDDEKANVNYQFQYKEGGQWLNVATGGTGNLSTGNLEYPIVEANYGKELKAIVYTTEDNTLTAQGGIVGPRVFNAGSHVLKVNDTAIGTALTSVNYDKDTPANNQIKITKVTFALSSGGGVTPKTLVLGKDYTLGYENIDGPGTATVTVYLNPTANTNYTTGKASWTYTLTATGVDSLSYTITAKDGSSRLEYEYTGKTIKPDAGDVVVTNVNGEKVSNYEVLALGATTVDAAKSGLDVYVKITNANGTTITAKDKTNVLKAYITPKDVTKHEADFKWEVPEGAWERDASSIGTKTGDDKLDIKLYDTTVNETEDLVVEKKATANVADQAAGFVASVDELFWHRPGEEQTIILTAVDGGTAVGTLSNYKGELTYSKEYEATSIKPLMANFKDAIQDLYLYGDTTGDTVSDGVPYNGYEQNYIPDGKDFAVNPNLTLREGYHFSADIIKGGTNVGPVSIKITGLEKGGYKDSFVIDAYSIVPADFSSAAIVTAKVTNPVFNPAINSAQIKDYDWEKGLALTLNGKDPAGKATKYALTYEKDYWLINQIPGSTLKEIKAKPTVKFGTLKNANFDQTTSKTEAAEQTFTLLDKDFADADITVTVMKAAYTGRPVTPEVKVTYTAANGRTYEIDDEYYDVASTGPIEKGASGTATVTGKHATNTAQYPGLYKGYKNVKFVVDGATLEGAKIVSKSGATTLPSKKYDAEQAAKPQGICLETSDYKVVDSKGQEIAPQYYTVSFTNNKAVGDATITITGKGNYSGSISSTYKIVANSLPAGTVTLVHNTKPYTGEAVTLTSGVDYVVSGSLGELTEGTDYMVVYENNMIVSSADSKAVMKFVGIGGYAGELKVNFDIIPAVITAKDITLGESVYSAGVAVRPEVTITIPGGKATLKEGTDYTVTYNPVGVNAGDKGKVVINYAATQTNINGKDSVKEVEYTVAAKDLADCTATVVDGKIVVKNGEVTVPETEYTVSEENGVITATAKADGNYTGSISAKVVTAPAATTLKVSGKTTSTVTLKWDAVEDAEGYTIWYNSQTDPELTRKVVSGGDKTSYTVKNLEAGVKYYFIVRSWVKTDDGFLFSEKSNDGKTARGTTRPEAAVIKVVNPRGNGKVTVGLAGPAKGADGYSICYSKTADFKKTYLGINTTSTVRSFTAPKGTYYVRVRSYVNVGDGKMYGDWSNTVKVTVK